MRKPIETYQMITQVNATATTGTSGPVTLRDFDFNSLVFTLSCSALAGTTPTLDVTVQTTPDGGSTWYDMLRFPRFTASGVNPAMGAASQASMSAPAIVGPNVLSSSAGGNGAPLLSNTIRANWTLGGTTPTGSFNVNALISGQQGAGQ